VVPIVLPKAVPDVVPIEIGLVRPNLCKLVTAVWCANTGQVSRAILDTLETFAFFPLTPTGLLMVVLVQTVSIVHKLHAHHSTPPRR
jgi:hypothetical protein